MSEPINISEAREAFVKTTQGEWKTVADSYSLPEWFVVSGDGTFGQGQIAGPSEPCSECDDFEWIAKSHNDYPAMLDELERLRETVAKQQAELGEYWRAAVAIESADGDVFGKGLADLHEIRIGNNYSQVGPSVAEMLIRQRDELAKEVERLREQITEYEQRDRDKFQPECSYLVH